MKFKYMAAWIFLIAATITACASQETATQTQPQIEQSQSTPAPTEAAQQVIISSPAAASTETPAAISQPAASVPGVISYSNDIQPILDTYCVECHGGRKIKEGLNLSSYDGAMNGSFNGPVVSPGDAANSFMIKQILDGEMPPDRNPKLSKEQFQLLVDWVNAGANNN